MRGTLRRRLRVTTSAVVILVTLLDLSACSSSDAGKAASTPTSIGDAAVAAEVADLEPTLLDASDLPGDFARVAEVSFSAFDLCGQDILESTPPSGRLAVAHGNPDENLVLENVLVYADTEEAAAFMDAFSAEVATCETGAPSGDGTTAKTSVRAAVAPDVGDRTEAAAIAGTDSSGRHYTADMVVSQVGNVVVVLSSANLGDPPVGKDVLDTALATAVTKVKTAQDA